MKNNIELLKDKIEFLYKEVARQKRDIEELNKLILLLMKLVAVKESKEDIELL